MVATEFIDAAYERAEPLPKNASAAGSVSPAAESPESGLQVCYSGSISNSELILAPIKLPQPVTRS